MNAKSDGLMKIYDIQPVTALLYDYSVPAIQRPFLRNMLFLYYLPEKVGVVIMKQVFP